MGEVKEAGESINEGKGESNEGVGKASDESVGKRLKGLASHIPAQRSLSSTVAIH